MFCKHKWEKIAEQTLPSGYEQMKDKINNLEGGSILLFYKKYICILQCSKCGKLDKTIESNP
jgi:hypothetical protein